MLYGDEIEAGIELLDREVPGWLGRIDLDILDVQSPGLCILAQLFGNYVAGLNALNVLHGRDHGFSVYSDDTPDYPTLTREWSEAITRLRAERVTAQ